MLKFWHLNCPALWECQPRHFVSKEVLRNLYFGIFFSLMNYGAQIWGQYSNSHVKRISKINDKAIRTLCFAHYQENASKYYKELNILKFQDTIMLNNFVYIHDHFSHRLPSALLDKYEYIHEGHEHNTRISSAHCIKLPKSRTVEFGIHSISGQASRHWNHLNITLSKANIHQLSRTSCKEIISKHLISKY